MPIKSRIKISPGFVDYFAASVPPAGWLECNGAAISRTTYAALFLAIGTTFGAGDGSTTFNIPDCRGEFIRGWDNGRGVDSGRALGSGQASQNLSHRHNVSVVGFAASGLSSSAGSGYGAIAYGSIDPGPENTVGNRVSPSDNAGALYENGGSEARVRNVSMLTCIKF